MPAAAVTLTPMLAACCCDAHANACSCCDTDADACSYLLWTCPPGFEDSTECKTSCILGGQYCAVGVHITSCVWQLEHDVACASSVHAALCGAVTVSGVHRSVHLALLQYGQVATGSGKSPPYSGAQPDPDGSLAEGYSGKDVLDFNIRQLCFARVSAKAGQPWLWWGYAESLFNDCSTKQGRFTPACARERLFPALGSCLGKDGEGHKK
eukprot:1150277-Pelagomonas_calceolata.AAC.2